MKNDASVAPRRLSTRTVAALAAVAVFGSAAAQAQNDPAPAEQRGSYIVICTCPSLADREAIARAVKRLGGSVLDIHRAIPSLTIGAPERSVRRFLRSVRQIENVSSVFPSAETGLHR